MHQNPETSVFEENQNDPPGTGMIELDAASVEVVAGGLNPQPEPPGRSEHFVSRLGSVLAF